MQYEVDVHGRIRQVHIRRSGTGFVVAVDGHEWPVDAARTGQHTLSLLVGRASHEVALVADAASGRVATNVDGMPVAVALNTRRRRGQKDAPSGSGPQRLTAPMPGKVVRILARLGDVVRARQPLVVIEAMKMENELRAARDGVVTEAAVQEGQSVEAGALLFVVAPA